MADRVTFDDFLSLLIYTALLLADPDLELRGGRGEGGGLDFVALLAFFPSVISSSFAQNKGGGGTGPSGPLP